MIHRVHARHRQCGDPYLERLDTDSVWDVLAYLDRYGKRAEIPAEVIAADSLDALVLLAELWWMAGWHEYVHLDRFDKLPERHRPRRQRVAEWLGLGARSSPTDRKDRWAARFAAAEQHFGTDRALADGPAPRPVRRQDEKAAREARRSPQRHQVSASDDARPPEQRWLAERAEAFHALRGRLLGIELLDSLADVGTAEWLTEVRRDHAEQAVSPASFVLVTMAAEDFREAPRVVEGDPQRTHIAALHTVLDDIEGWQAAYRAAGRGEASY